MKRYIKSTYDPTTIGQYIDQVVENIAAYVHHESGQVDDSFIHRVCEDKDVQIAKLQLETAILNAVGTQMS